jgi:hypothetical protein
MKYKGVSETLKGIFEGVQKDSRFLVAVIQNESRQWLRGRSQMTCNYSNFFL